MTTYDSQSFIKQKKNAKGPSVPLKVFPQTGESFTNIAFGRISGIISINLMELSLDKIFEALGLDDFTHTRKVSSDIKDFFY